MNLISDLAAIYTPANWRESDADALAAKLNEPVSLRPMTLVQFFAAVVQAGGDARQLAPLWSMSAIINATTTALASGDLAAMQAILLTLPIDVDTATATALQSVVSANTLTHASANGIASPVTAEAVTEWMTAAGWTWDSETNAWTHQ